MQYMMLYVDQGSIRIPYPHSKSAKISFKFVDPYPTMHHGSNLPLRSYSWTFFILFMWSPLQHTQSPWVPLMDACWTLPRLGMWNIGNMRQWNGSIYTGTTRYIYIYMIERPLGTILFRLILIIFRAFWIIERIWRIKWFNPFNPFNPPEPFGGLKGLKGLNDLILLILLILQSPLGD